MNKRQQTPEDFEKMADYLAGEASEKEQRELEQWFEDKPENRTFFNKIKKVWQASQLDGEKFCPDIACAWQKVKPINEGKVVPITSNLKTRTTNSSGKKWYYYVAASVVILMGVWVLVQEDHIVPKLTLDTKQMDAHEKGELTLSDGSKIWLNSNSQFYYPETFDEERVVYLEGEAYFEVESDATRPFIIHTGRGVTEVLGTSFNLNNQQEEVKVTVTSGKVALYAEGNPDEKIIMEPGEVGIYHLEKDAMAKAENTDANFLSWKTGVLTFNGTPLADVAKALSRHYQVEVSPTGEISKKCRLTSTFDNKSLDEVLELIGLTLDVKVRKEGDQVFIEGAGC